VVALIIAKDLAKIISNCFINGTILKSLKEFIIVVLYNNKKEKLLPFKQL